jgi:hypothetical protein
MKYTEHNNLNNAMKAEDHVEYYIAVTEYLSYTPSSFRWLTRVQSSVMTEANQI